MVEKEAKDGTEANAKSSLKPMTLGAKDEAEAVEALAAMISEG